MRRSTSDHEVPLGPQTIDGLKGPKPEVDMSEHATFFVGVDISDKNSQICVLDAEAVVAEIRIRTTPDGFRRCFETLTGTLRVALEVGTHSTWISRLLEELGHEVIVANPRRLALISENHNKSDETDAELLARVVRLDPELLAPIKHRSERHQRAQSLLRARDCLVRDRTRTINFVRATLKTHGHRLPASATYRFHLNKPHLPIELRGVLGPMMDVIEILSETIEQYNKSIEGAGSEFEEVALLRSVSGIGPITALAFVATVQDPSLFENTRDVGPYLGVKPRRNQSGDADPQLRITKAGDGFTRRLLVSSAQQILGPFGKDSDLRRWGLSLAQRGGKAAKKRAAVAVARKLAVIMLSMWKSGRSYEPFPNGQPELSAA